MIYVLIFGISISATKVSVSNQPLTFEYDLVIKTLTFGLDIVDIKPVNMEELTEVITATEFHPTQCNLFMYSSSKSNIKLADMRDSALCDRHAKCKCFFTYMM
jgi:hypothetical protein